MAPSFLCLHSNILSAILHSMAGYSNAPLAKKLELKERQRIAILNPAENFIKNLEPLPDYLKIISRPQTDLDAIILFVRNAASGLVDNKVCAIDEVWSALRFVYRLKDRPRRENV